MHLSEIPCENGYAVCGCWLDLPAVAKDCKYNSVASTEEESVQEECMLGSVGKSKYEYIY